MKRTIIYVFGPKRLATKYFANEEMIQNEGGWLKIGQTSEEDDTKDKWDSAMYRIKAETHTGIPEVSQLYDVFEYPYRDGNNDDRLRFILAEDIYKLESSKLHNRGLEQYEIKAGREFVYGVSRNQILNAVAKYERNLILENYGKADFNDLMELIKKNNTEEEEQLTPNIDDNSLNPDESKSDWCDKLWDSVIKRINMKEKIINPKGRPYIYFKSPTHLNFSYVLGYSIRYSSTTVSIETSGGETAKNSFNKFIEENDILSKIPNLRMNQGVKNKDKWSWSVADSLDKSDVELSDWFMSTLLLFYNSFEIK